MRKQNAFTLVELLVAISVIALLMAILMPALRKAREVALMVVCSNNQRQVILGLLTYSNSNDLKLPPSPGKDGNAWHRPNDLNFTSKFWSKRAPLTDAEMWSVKDTYHYAGRYLGTILKNSEVFNCPVSKIRDSAAWPPYGAVAGAGTYGEFYRTGRYATLPCTYSLLYSFDGFNKASAGAKPFDAPNEASDKNTLVIQDTLMYLKGNPELAWLPNPTDGQYSFHTCHSFPNAFYFEPYFSLKRLNADLSVLPKEMNGLKLDAGYLDGHVEKFNATETVHLTHNNMAHNWLTQKYK
ncbi:MAG: type II secretion system protein [Planctomycetota bacterium]